jgi:hypothetical protein
MTDATNARRTASALSVLVASMRMFSPAIEHVSVLSLKPYPRSARRHSRAQIKQIAASIERFGFNNPVLVADDGLVASGLRVCPVTSCGITKSSEHEAD